MSRWIISFFLGMILLSVACGAPPPDPAETVIPEEEDVLATVEPTATPAAESPTATPESYPVRPTPTPAVDGGYPAAAPPPTAYPVDMRIWVLRPLGYQCEEADTYPYATIEEAITALNDAGIEVFDSETTELMVCEACGCPTSEHYRVEILRSDYHSAQMLGWFQES